MKYTFHIMQILNILSAIICIFTKASENYLNMNKILKTCNGLNRFLLRIVNEMVF